MWYTYDSLGRVITRIISNTSNNSIISTETFNYDAAGNVTSAPDGSFQYDTNNRLISFNGNTVSYDLDGNMLSNGSLTCTYDSANRLITAGGHTYAYNAEDVRIRNLCADEDTTYTYNTNAKLSMLLMKTTGGVVTKYVYGNGLIGEEVSGVFKTYHFDCRGSTIAITDASGNITDTFAYDTYGKLISRTGTSKVIFGYNGRDGVVTDDNGLIYMRARYYSPEMKRFINADIVAGKISNAVTLNRFAYANGNPVSFVDPFGLSPERGAESTPAPNFNQAILVSNRDMNDGGLFVVGHTQLYLYNKTDGTWYCTEYTGPWKTIIDKTLATVRWYKCDAPVLTDFDSNEKIDYVVLDGDFNESAAYAKQMAGNSLGGYDLLYNNCCDYTDDLLSKAEINGFLVEKYIDKRSADEDSISIPYSRVQAMQWRDKIDDTVRAIKETANRIWAAITFWD